MPKHAILRHFSSQNLAIFLPVILQFFMKKHAMFVTGTRLACNPLTNRLHRVRLHRVRQIAYM